MTEKIKEETIEIKDSYIQSVHAKNIGLFDELDIRFNKRFNFIIGPNGCGKTSILKIIAVVFDRNKLKIFRFGKNTELWIDFILNERNYRVGFMSKAIFKGDQYQMARYRGYYSKPKKGSFDSILPQDLEVQDINFTPLFIGAYRKIDYSRIEGTQRVKNPKIKRDEFRNSSINSLDGTYLPNVKQWMINRYFFAPQEWARIENINWNWLKENIKYIGPKGVNFEFIDIKPDLEPIFSIDGVECYLEELSAGYQAILSLIFSIFDWIEGTNEHDYNKIIKNAKGTVLIDELDIHMHPEWQFAIRDTLEKIFPNLQFITTTHSPHLISTAKSNELIILKGFKRVIKVRPTTKCYSGWTTDQILKDLMGVKSLKYQLHEKLLLNASEFIKHKDAESLKELILKYKEKIHPSDTIIEQLEIKLARLLLEDD